MLNSLGDVSTYLKTLQTMHSRNNLVSTHEDLSVVFIQSTLVVSDSRHVLDDNAVVGVLTLLVQDRVSLNHVINDIGLGDLLGAELLLGAQVLAVVVAQVVVAGNGGQLDTSVDEEVNEGRLHLGLARLEVVTTDVGIVLLGELNGTRNKGVLGRTVDERGLLQDRCNSKNGGRRNLLVTLIDSLQKVIGGIVDTRNDIGVTLSVGGPHDDDLVKTVLLLELADIITDVLNVGSGSLRAFDDVVGTILLVGSNEVRVVDGRQRNHLSHLLLDLGLESRLKNLSAVHGLCKVQLADIPTANDKVIRVDHGEDIMEGNVDVFVGLGISTKLEGRAHNERAIVVGLARTFLGFPANVATVGNDTSGDSGTVVAAPSDQHHADLGDLAFDLELIGSLPGSGDEVAVGIGFDASGAVSVLGLDLIVSVGDVGRVDSKSGGRGGSGLGVSGGIGRPVRGARKNFSVRSHGID